MRKGYFIPWIVLLTFCFHKAFADDHADTLFVKQASYSFFILKNNLSYGTRGVDNAPHVMPHPGGGLRFGKWNEELYSARFQKLLGQSKEALRLSVVNEKGLEGVLTINFYSHYLSVHLDVVSHDASEKYTIDFRSGFSGPGYGLGDHGGFGEGTAITDFFSDDFGNRDNEHRFISTFTIFPANHFAQVLFEEKTKRVTINRKENRLGTTGVQSARIYYFLGNPHAIYKNFKEVKRHEGYPDLKPKYTFFDLGYEAFGSLGWNTYQESVQEDVAHYLENGFKLKWAVVGSGFWPGERQVAQEGSTTSFGLWDNRYQAGRKDKLPSPRYPDVTGFKRFFQKRGVDLLLGLRINFKADSLSEGNYFAPDDGPYALYGREKKYFVGDELGNDPATYKVIFPKGNVWLLDTHQDDAVRWYVKQAKKWDVAGFKEDLMLLDGKKLNNDAKVDPVNRLMMEEGFLVMARNGAYAVPGDILRLEDTQYGFDQDRPLINGLNYAASGAAGVYLDIVAGKYLKLPLTDDQEKYFVRNALMAAVSPVMAMGLGPWHLSDTLDQAIVKKAADWHHRYAPYIYSAAVKSFETGYPYTMTPLPIVYPNDTATYFLASKSKKQYNWFLGESLLATPLYGSDYATAIHRDVYLPAGRWMDYESKEIFKGPTLLTDYALPLDKIPLFIGGQGVLVSQEGRDFFAELYPVAVDTFTYTFHAPKEQKKATIYKKVEGLVGKHTKVRDLSLGKDVAITRLEGSLSFLLKPGHAYEIYN